MVRDGRFLVVASVGLLAPLLPCLTARAEEPPAGPFFEQRVAPILSRCVRCHNGDKLSGGLDLTSRATAEKGGESGPALVANDPAKSLLYAMVSSRKMPPRQPLSAAEIDSL